MDTLSGKKRGWMGMSVKLTDRDVFFIVVIGYAVSIVFGI